jgi:chromosome segregation ATPase
MKNNMEISYLIKRLRESIISITESSDITMRDSKKIINLVTKISLQISDFEDNKNRLDNIIVNLDEKIKKLILFNEERDRNMNIMAIEILESNRQEESLDEKLTNKENEVIDLLEKLDDKNDEISRLEDEINKLNEK